MFLTMTFPMKKLHRNRDITIYVPDDYYYSDKRYPVLYIQDGQNAFFDHQSYSGVSWGFLEFVKKYDLDIIMVAIPCNFEGFKRMDEYGPWVISEELSYEETKEEGVILGGEGIAYVEWMVHELKPYIDKRFPTIVEDCGIVGSSMGGVISAYASLAYPEVFRKCAALSTAFWFYMDEFEELVQGKDYSYIDCFYFDLGEFEGCGNSIIDRWYIETNDMIYNMLENRIENIVYHYFEGACHNESEWRKRVPLFMECFYKEE